MPHNAQIFAVLKNCVYVKLCYEKNNEQLTIMDLSNQWKVNTHGLFKELSGNVHIGPATSGLRILQGILSEVALRAVELNDKELNKLMLRLSLYSISDPQSEDFDQKKVQEYLDS